MKILKRCQEEITKNLLSFAVFGLLLCISGYFLISMSFMLGVIFLSAAAFLCVVLYISGYHAYKEDIRHFLTDPNKLNLFKKALASILNVVKSILTAKSLTQNQETKILDIFEYLKFLLPIRYREEAVGDLGELVARMKARNLHAWKIFFILICYFINIVVHLRAFKLGEFFSRDQQKKSAD